MMQIEVTHQQGIQDKISVYLCNLFYSTASWDQSYNTFMLLSNPNSFKLWVLGI